MIMNDVHVLHASVRTLIIPVTHANIKVHAHMHAYVRARMRTCVQIIIPLTHANVKADAHLYAYLRA